MTYEIIPLHKNATDITGRTFGRLTAIAPVGRATTGNLKWLFICLCGTESVVRSDVVVHGVSLSCGCLQSDLAKERKTIHGLSKTEEYESWSGMMQRCLDKSDKEYRSNAANYCHHQDDNKCD